MLTEKQIDMLLKVVDVYRDDAKIVLDVLIENEEERAEEQEEYEQWTEIEMILEAMKTADWSSDIEVLRRENAVLKVILGEIQKGAQNIVDAMEELKR